MSQRITTYGRIKTTSMTKNFRSHFLSFPELTGCLKAKNKIVVFAWVISFESRANFKLTFILSAAIKFAAFPRVICAQEQWTLSQQYNCKILFAYCCMFLAMICRNGRKLNCSMNGALPTAYIKHFMNKFDVCLTVHRSSMWNKKSTRCHLVLYLFLLYKLLNMFRATLCPSSGSDDLVVFLPRVV